MCPLVNRGDSIVCYTRCNHSSFQYRENMRLKGPLLPIATVCFLVLAFGN